MHCITYDYVASMIMISKLSTVYLGNETLNMILNYLYYSNVRFMDNYADSWTLTSRVGPRRYCINSLGRSKIVENSDIPGLNHNLTLLVLSNWNLESLTTNLRTR